MGERFVLIAEDDQQAIESWERDIREFNRAGGEVSFTAEYARNCRDALRALERVRVDCAVVDLRMPVDAGSQGRNNDPVGNEVLERVLLDVGIPAVVYSGYPQEVSARVRASRILVVPKKGDGGAEVLAWLAQHESLMSAMDVTRARIQRESARLFSNSIWPRWEDKWQRMADRDQLAEVITRQIVSHVAEQLTLSPNDSHPEEFYIVPPLDVDRLGTGDLVKIDEKVYVVVSPRCNMARDSYPAHLILAPCKPMDEEWSSMRERFAGSAKEQKSAADQLRRFATQDFSLSSHFLPPCDAAGPWLVQFKDVLTVESRTAVPDLLRTRFASIASQFVPNLVQRYPAYLGRFGQPDLDTDELRARVCK